MLAETVVSQPVKKHKNLVFQFGSNDAALIGGGHVSRSNVLYTPLPPSLETHKPSCTCEHIDCPLCRPTTEHWGHRLFKSCEEVGERAKWDWPGEVQRGGIFVWTGRSLAVQTHAVFFLCDLIIERWRSHLHSWLRRCAFSFFFHR